MPDATDSVEKIMTIDSKTEYPLTARFIDDGTNVLLELVNEGDQTLKCVEVLTIFLKDEETPGGGPSQANIKFTDTERITQRESRPLS